MNIKITPLSISQRRKMKEKLEKSSVFVNSQRANTGLHLSIVKCGEDILDSIKLTPCTGCEVGCGKPGKKKNRMERYHCPLCITSIFKPAVYCKTKKHVLNHFQGRCAIVLRGFKITGCHLKCVNYSRINQQRSHFHCPFCSDTFANKSFLIKHGRHCGLNFEQHKIKDSLQTEKLNDVNIDSTQTTNSFSKVERAHQLFRRNEIKECKKFAVKKNSENEGTPNKHSKFRKLSYTNINETIEDKFRKMYDRNEIDRKVYPPVECNQCQKLYHPKYIYQHIRIQHNTVKSTPKISESRYHHSVLIDYRLYLYTSAKTISGMQVPLHVIKRLNDTEKNPSLITFEELNKRYICESEDCMNKCRSEWAAGKIEYLCDHLKSVDFSVEPGNGSSDDKWNWLDKELLNTQALYEQLLEIRYERVFCLNSMAFTRNTPMIVELPQVFKTYHKTKQGSHRFTFYSVYTGLVSKWSKFERTVVTIDHVKRIMHCRCQENACVHRGAVICWLYQNEKLDVNQLAEVKYKEKHEAKRVKNKLKMPKKTKDNKKNKIKVAKKTRKELSIKTIYVVDKDSENLGIQCESRNVVSENKKIISTEGSLLHHNFVYSSILHANVNNPVLPHILKKSLSKEFFTNKHEVIQCSDLHKTNHILPIVPSNSQEKIDISSNSPINIVTNKVRKVFKVMNMVADDDSLFRAAGESLEDYTQEDYAEIRDLVECWLTEYDQSLYRINPQSINIHLHGLLNQGSSNNQSNEHINPIQPSTVQTPILISQPLNNAITSSQDICNLQISTETKIKQPYNLIGQSRRTKFNITSEFQKQSYQPNNKEFTPKKKTSFNLSSHNEKQYIMALSNIFSVTIKLYNSNGGYDDHIDTYTPLEGVSEATLHFRRDRSGYYDALIQTVVPDELYTL